MPSQIIRMCEFLNQNKRFDNDVEKGAGVIANGAANDAVIKDQPGITTDVVIVNGNGYHNDQKS